MKKPLVLVSAVGGDIGRAVAVILHRAGYRVEGTDTRHVDDPYNVLSDYHRVPPASDSGYIKAVYDLMTLREAHFFIPVSEPEILCVDAHRGELDGTATQVVINNPFIVRTFSDKFETALFLAKQQLPAPRTTPLDQYQGEFGFPFIAKARFGCGSKQVWTILDETDWRYISHKKGGDYIAQELIGEPDEEYTTGVFSDGQRTFSISFRRRLGFGGLTMNAELVNPPQLFDLASKIAAHSQLVGSINIQSRRTGKVFVPFEINPRFSSTLPMRRHFGFDDAVWWLEVLMGRQFDYKPLFSRGRVVRCLAEHYFELD